ncbi:hypothetical protein KRIGEM_03306 [Komagataeibacter rhaeticus]|nr:hypothetical protein KRIGEM_03306 [Komagataeibacter rhaeticus]
MPGRTGSGIAAGDRLAGAWGSRFCLVRPLRGRQAKLGGPRVLDAVRFEHGTTGRLTGCAFVVMP